MYSNDKDDLLQAIYLKKKKIVEVQQCDCISETTKRVHTKFYVSYLEKIEIENGDNKNSKSEYKKEKVYKEKIYCKSRNEVIRVLAQIYQSDDE